MGRVKHYVIEGTPIAWARAGRNGFKYYDTQLDTKSIFGLKVSKQHGHEPIFEGPIEMDFTFEIPLTDYAKNKYKNVSQDKYFHFHIPDLDNLIKFCLDALRDIIYKDDRIVSAIHCKKIYSKTPKTIFTVKELI